MKKLRDKPSGVIVHTNMEISQGNTLCSYLYLKLKCHAFHFLFSLFSSTKSENKKVEQSLPREGGLAPVREGRCWGNRVGG
jgi:hypothetical protein